MKKISTGIILAFSTCFMLFIYAPLELFFTNQVEFWFDVYVLFPPIVCNFLLAFGCSVFIFLCVSRGNSSIYKVLLYVYFISFICLYIQGNFMAGWLPHIKGKEINWNDYPIERIKSILLWVIIIVVVYILKWFMKEIFEEVIKVVSVCLGLMLMVSIMILCVTTGGYQRKEMATTATAKNLLTMSKRNNFIILVLDSVDAPTFNTICKADPKYKEMFDDFTYYTNAASGYPYTVHSIPLILTGEWYEKQCDFEDFARQAYSRSPLFEELENENYRMGFYETDIRLNQDDWGRFDNISDGIWDSQTFLRLCAWEIKMMGYRYAPFDLKRFCYVYTNELGMLKGVSDNEELFSDSNSFLWNKLLEDEIDLIEENCFKFIHVEGAHYPCKYDENMQITENSDYEASLKGSMVLASKYLDMLKAADIYDNSCIIIMADHGQGDGFNNNPVFLVKGFDEHHSLLIDDAPISYGDLLQAYEKLLAGEQSDNLFEWKAGDDRQRRFLFQDDDDNPERIMEEYVIDGHAGSWETMKKIREF